LIGGKKVHWVGISSRRSLSLGSHHAASAIKQRKNPIFGVILSAAKNLSSLDVQCTERFIASLGITAAIGFLRNLLVI
jgi:hypothetical protein